jgi:hypothetical protein
MGLVGLYLARVIAFTLRGSVRQADSWQIVAGGTALPSIALGIIYGLLGRRMPTIEQAEWASYFGYGLITWLALRFFVAPFFIWKELYAETTELRLELTKPERMVMEHLAKHRAKARAKLASALEAFQSLSFCEEWNETAERSWVMQGSKIDRLKAEAGVSRSFNKGCDLLLTILQEEASKPNNQQPGVRKSEKLVALLQRHLMGEITAEDLALQLPTSTAPETLQ